MLVELKLGGPQKAEAPLDALGLLLECHERIRRHCALAVKLADSKDAPAAQVSDAARQVARYFGVALPLHVEDEDFSLAPRLELRGGRAEDQKNIELMIEQHEAIEFLLGRLLPKWNELAQHPELSAQAQELKDDTARLAELLATHLELEETHLFPLARAVLTPRELAEVADEIKDRRRA